MKRDAQINTQSWRSQLSDVDAGVVRWRKTNSDSHPFQALANINENLIRNGGFVPLLTKTLCTIHNNQFVLESGDTANMGRSEMASLFSLSLSSFKEWMSQASKARVMLRIASPIRKTAAIKDASGKNLAITEPTPRNTDEIRMAARSVPMSGAVWLRHDDKTTRSLLSGSALKCHPTRLMCSISVSSGIPQDRERFILWSLPHRWLTVGSLPVGNCQRYSSL